MDKENLNICAPTSVKFIIKLSLEPIFLTKGKAPFLFFFKYEKPLQIARGSVNPDIAKRLDAEFRIFDEAACYDTESYKWICVM